MQSHIVAPEKAFFKKKTVLNLKIFLKIPLLLRLIAALFTKNALPVKTGGTFRFFSTRSERGD